MFGEISGVHVMSGVVVSVTLVFLYTAVALRSCRYDNARNITITGSFCTEEVDVLSQLKCWEVLGPIPSFTVFLL